MDCWVLVHSPLVGPAFWSPMADVLGERLPDAVLRRQLFAGSPHLPAGLFSEPMPADDRVAMGRQRFCRLSSAYDAAADQAERDGWQVARLAAQHLAPFTDPVPVADAIQELITR